MHRNGTRQQPRSKCSHHHHHHTPIMSSPGSPFQRRPTSSKNPDTFSSFCSVHPAPNHMRMRSRNDEEFFGSSGFRRSSSMRRSSNNNDGLSGGGNHGLGGHLSRGLYPGRAERRNNDQQTTTGRNRSTSSNYRNNNNNMIQNNNNNNSDYSPGYLQGTLTSIRRSRERAAASPSFSRTPSIRRSQNSKHKTSSSALNLSTRFESDRPALLRPTSLYYPTSTPVLAHQSSVPTPSAATTTCAPATPAATSAVSKDSAVASNFKTSNSSNNLSDYYRIYKPSNGGLIISQKGGNFTRTGSFSSRQIQPQPTLASQSSVQGLGSKPESTFMRSFSFRKREANDEHHSSMPCLNANFRFVFACLFVCLNGLLHRKNPRWSQLLSTHLL